MVFLITVALTAGWLVADYRSNAGTRRTLGVLALLWSLGLAAVLPFLENLNANAYFTAASKKLLHASVQQFHGGKGQAVLQAWSRADDQFQFRYEDHGKYREVVDQAVIDMQYP